MPVIRASTRLFAVLGDPVAHSLSPLIQNRAIERARCDAVYVSLRCAEAELEGLMRGIAFAGGGGNVTLPHKMAAARILDVASENVRLTGACNTFWAEAGCLHGDNTDVAGFRDAAGDLVDGGLTKGSVLLIGAGGAARAALVALMAEKVAEVAIWNRTRSRADALASELGGDITKVVDSLTSLNDRRFDLVVNTTSLGLEDDDPLPLDLDGMCRPSAVLDLAYRPDETAWVRAARSLGIPAADGGTMLVAQGAKAFETWWGKSAPIDEMSRALDEARSGVSSNHREV